jgi:acyl carrier protein phosphodiesterase
MASVGRALWMAVKYASSAAQAIVRINDAVEADDWLEAQRQAALLKEAAQLLANLADRMSKLRLVEAPKDDNHDHP